MRYLQFARITARALTAAGVAGALLLGATPAPALAVSARPRSAPQFNGGVFAIAYRGDIAYVGGSFTAVTAGGRVVARQRLAAFNARTGALLNWRPTANGTVRALAVSGNAVYAGGSFGTVSGQRRDNLARLDATSGALASFSHTVTGDVATLAVGSGRLYVGGRFSAVDKSARGNLAAFSLTRGTLDAGWRPKADNHVDSLATYGSRVYLGGNFKRVNGVTGTVRLAAVTATTGKVVLGFRPKPPANVLDVAVDLKGVYASTGGAGGRAIAYSTAGKVRWVRLFNGDAHTITTLAGTTYVGGHFDTACRSASTIRQLGCVNGSVSRVKLAAIDPHGRLSGWNPRANGVVGVRVLATNGALRQIGAGGEFTAIGGVKRERYASFG
jgi:hypothetical protein